MRVETVRENGAGGWDLGLVGTRSEQFVRASLTAEDLAGLTITDATLSYQGDGRLLRLALQAHTLGIAYEFDPYFGLSISRVDPLPHQLEAVYEHLLKLPTVRFLLADDAGAGKTIMAGLLLRELKLRGLVERVLVACPANLAFQWQRGGDFCFIGRQRRLRIDDEWYRVDLVFFHRVLRCLVLIDLKVGKFTHADAGQMHLYLNYAREHWVHEHENPPVGLILCAEKGESLARYALEGLPNKVMAPEYRTALPDEATLAAELKRARRELQLGRRST